jgi:hypothetical protein
MIPKSIRLRWRLALPVVALVTFVTASLPSALAVGTPTPDYTAADWAALPPEKQAAELDTYPDGSANPPGEASNPEAKTAEVTASPDPGPAADLGQAALADGPGAEYVPGISESTQSPFSTQDYVFQNSWQDLNATGTTLNQAWAGASATASTQGVIAVNELPWPANEDTIGTSNVYPAPTGLGALTFTSAGSGRLYFTSASAQTGSFDLATRTYTLDPVGKGPPPCICPAP